MLPGRGTRSIASGVGPSRYKNYRAPLYGQAAFARALNAAAWLRLEQQAWADRHRRP